MELKLRDDLNKLTDQELLASTDKLVKEERRISLLVLQHLREIEVRRLYVDLGFESMYKYCIQCLKYSEGEAQRRLSAARLLEELPEIEAQIQSGNLNITNLSAVQSFVRTEKMADKPLTRAAKLELISNLENKSTRQVKLELIQQSHQPAMLAEKLYMPASSVTVPVITFETLLTEENQNLLQEFENLYAHDLADLSNQSVLLFLLDKAVQHKKKKLGLIEKDPVENNAQLPSAAHVEISMTNLVKDIQEIESNTLLQNEVFTTSVKSEKFEKQRKAVPIKLQRQVWQRSQACCEHIDGDSKEKCRSKFALEIDHIFAVALGGANDIDNLRLLCRAHNSRMRVKTLWRKIFFKICQTVIKVSFCIRN